MTSFDPYTLFVSGAHYFHFTDWEAETQRAVICPRSQIKLDTAKL